MKPSSDQSSESARRQAATSDEMQRQREDDLRASILAELDAQRSQLRGSLADLRTRARGADGTGEAQQIEQQLTELDGLRQQVALAGSIQALSNLQHRIGETGQRGNDAARQGSDRAASGQWFMATAEHQRRSAELAREAHTAMAQNDRLFREGADVARRYGVDLSAFAEERAKLTKERDEAEQRGDHLHARMADVLIARNTTNSLSETLPHITDPAERARQLVRIERAKEQEEAARKRLEHQAEMDGRKQATERGLSPEAAKAHVESFTAETMQKLEDRHSKQLAPRSSSKPHASLNRDMVSPSDRELAGKLTPESAAHARQAAAAITGSQPAESSAGEAKAPPSATASRSVESRTV